jgi:predicted unusual protein kinase regulating ubiquinone biosynthesis (AarF/ABC1/UbiB family)
MLKTIRWYRIMVIMTLAVRSFLELWLVYRKKGSRSVEWEATLRKQGQRFNRTAIKLEGLMVKVGQFLSTRVDVLPLVFTEQLQGLVDQVPPISWKHAHRLLVKEWGQDYEQKISIVKTPRASASIAVVYQGEWIDGSQKLAIKIQRPTIKRMIQADLRAIRVVLWLAKTFTSWGKWVDTKAIYQEVKETMSRELDFRIEQQQAAKFAGLAAPFHILIPRYHAAFTTSRVLVMDWIESVPITDRAFLQANGLQQSEITYRLLSAFLWQLTRSGCFHADPHPGNVHIQQDGTIVLFDFGMVGLLREDSREALVKLVRTAILQDYSGMTVALEELGFLRKPEFRKQIEQSLELFMRVFTSNQGNAWDEDKVTDVLTELRQYVNEQPLQLPAEFAFLGRAVGILSGVLSEIDPSLDYIQLGKRVLPQLGIDRTDATPGFGDIIWKQVQELGMELWKFPNRIRNAIQAFTDYLEQQQTDTHMKLEASYYVHKRQSYLGLTVIGAVISVLLFMFQTSISGYIPAAISVLMFIQVWRWDQKWYRWLQSQKNRNGGV